MNVRVEIARCRYLRDPLTRKIPSYTEYKLFIDSKLINTAICGVRFNNVNQYIKWCRKRFEITTDIDKYTHTINLGFHAQKM